MRRAIYEFNSITAVLCILAAIVFIMLFLHNHTKKWDFTKNKINTLSEQSISVLKSLKKPVKAVVFTDGEKNSRAENLIKLYSENASEFSYEIVDSIRNPKKASDYDVKSDVVIFLEADEKRERINHITEETVTNALVRLISEGRKNIYLLTGHKQLEQRRLPEAESKNSLSIFCAALSKEIYDIKPLNLMEKGAVPEDADIVIIADPKTPFSEQEMSALKEYSEKGGKTFWLIGSKFEKSNAKILFDLGISFSDGFIDDDESKLALGEFMTLVAINYSTDITKGLGNSFCLFPLSRNITFEDNADNAEKTNDVVFTPFAFTSSKSRIINSSDKKSEETGSCCVGLAAQRNKSRIIVISSALAVSDAIINQVENKNLFLNCIAWLAESENLISVRPKDQNITMLTLTDEAAFRVFFFTVIFPPSIFAALWLSIRIGRRFGGGKK